MAGAIGYCQRLSRSSRRQPPKGSKRWPIFLTATLWGLHGRYLPDLQPFTRGVGPFARRTIAIRDEAPRAPW